MKNYTKIHKNKIVTGGKINIDYRVYFNGYNIIKQRRVLAALVGAIA